jgi:antirestriction protein
MGCGLKYGGEIPLIEAYITNLGKYNEGKLRGEYLKLPADTSDLKALLARIGVDGVLYEETFITDYKSKIEMLCCYMGELESVDELNYLAKILSEMNEWEIEKFEAALEYGEHTSSVKDLINLTQNLDNYYFYPDIENEEDLGRYYIEELSSMEIPEHIEPYFDYEAYGRHVDYETGGIFIDGGYVENNGDNFIEYYSGRDDLPDEHRIFAYPEPPERMSIAEQIEMYTKMISAPAAVTSTPARKDRG